VVQPELRSAASSISYCSDIFLFPNLILRSQQVKGYPTVPHIAKMLTNQYSSFKMELLTQKATQVIYNN